MAAIPVILTWTGPQTVAQKGPAHVVLFSRRGTSLKLFGIELSYILNIKTPMPATLPWTLAQTVAPKLVPLID